MTEKPKILLVTDRVPGRTAGNEFRVANVIEGLLAVGDVHVCLIDSSDKGAPFAADERFDRSVVRAADRARWLRMTEWLWTLPHTRYGLESALTTKFLDAVEPNGWDLVWFNRARVHRFCSPLLDGEHILDLDDLNDRLRSLIAEDRRRRLGAGRSALRGIVDQLSAWRWRRHYQDLASRVARFVVCHEGDQAHLGLSNVTVVRNGYPDPGIDPRRAPGDANSMLFVGPLSYEPNNLAVRWFLDHVFDRVRAAVPDASLSVVGALGRDGRLTDDPNVEFHGWVHDVDDHYANARLALAPLHSGGGTRIKVLEAMAQRRPLVATTFAVEGLDLESTPAVRLADDAETFANHCIQLLTDDELAVAQSDLAYQRFLDNHEATHSIAAVSEAALSVLAERAPTARSTR